MATPRQGSTIMPTGAYSSDIARIVRELNAVAAASQGVFSALRAGLQAVQSQVVSFVEKANPAAVHKWKLAADDLTAAIGRALVPVLNNFTTFVQKLADYFSALSGPAKAMIAGLTAAAVGFTVVTVSIWAMNAAMSALTGGVWAIVSAVGAAIGGLVAGITFATSGTERLKQALDTIMGPLNTVLDLMGMIVTELVSAVMPVVEVMINLLALALKVVAAEVIRVAPLILKFATAFKALAEFLIGLLGIGLEDQKNVPPRAPAAVRQAQIGGLDEFLKRQMVNALQGASPKQDALQVGKQIAGDVRLIKLGIDELVNIGNRPLKGDVKKEAVANVARAGVDAALVPGGGGVNGALAALARRIVMSAVAGK